MQYMLYCENYNNNNDLTSKNNEQYVMTFGTLSKTIEFINLCTLYEMIYKIYCMEDKVKKLHSTYKYVSLGQNGKGVWQTVTM